MRRSLFSACLLASLAVSGARAEIANPQLAARYKQLLAAHPQPGVALDRLWKLYEDAGETSALLAAYEHTQASSAGALLYGYFLERAGRAAEAKAAFAKAAALDPKNAAPLIALAHLAPDPAEAARAWEKAAQLAPSPENLLALGNAWQLAGQPAQASAAWERASGLDPGNLALQSQLAANYEQQHLPAEALQHYRALAAASDPAQRAPALQKVAQLLEALGQPEEAERALDQALELVAPGNWLRAPLEAQLVRLGQRTGKLDALVQRWGSEVQAHPNDLGAYWKLADLYQQLGEAAQERKWLEKMATLSPDAPDIARRLVTAQRTAGDARAAAATLDRLLVLQPDESSLVLERADLDLQLDRPSAAIARLESLLQNRADDPALSRRVLDFYRRTRLVEPLERHLRADAGRGTGETLALARFLAGEQRADDAKSVLLTLVHPQETPAEQAEAWSTIATELKTAGDGAGSLQSLRQAVQLQPRAVPRIIALADALLASGQIAEAQQTMLNAWSIDPSEATDQKLFQALQAAPRRASDDPLDEPDMMAEPTVSGLGASRRYLETVLAEATQNPSPAALLRAARWLAWSGRAQDALPFAQRALKADPPSLAARQQILQLARTLSDRTLAQQQLTALISADPQHAPAWQRQLGQLQLEGGDLNAALTLFQQLAAAHPADPTALAQLALAQERADRWSDALATWQRAFALTPASRQREAAPPLLRALEHLGLLPAGGELLMRLVDEARDPAARAVALRDAREFCERHRRGEWFAAQVATRHQKDPADGAITRALAQLRQASGDEESALSLLRGAAEQTPDDVDLLREVVQAALALGRPEEAIAQQRRLVALIPSSDPAELAALAQAEENAGEIEAASGTWQQLTARFSRHVDTLQKAAAFFVRWQKLEPARAAWRRIRVLAPGDLESLLALARQTEPAEAASCYEQILARTSAAQPGDPLHFPRMAGRGSLNFQQVYFRAMQLRNGSVDSGRVQQLQTLWQSGGAVLKGEAALRQAAIQGLGEILFARKDESALREWRARWKTERPTSETLAAFSAIRDNAGLLTTLNTLLKARPDDASVRQAFIWLSLRLGSYAPLGRWLANPERPPEDFDLFFVAISRYAAEAPGDDSWLRALFPPGGASTFLRWQTAILLAEQERLEPAILLGAQVFASAPAQRVTTGELLAKWQVQAGRADEARATLRAAVESTGSTLDDSIYELLRACVLLLPAQERAGFEADYWQRWQSSPLHAANARLLFAALGGDAAALSAAVERLFLLAPTPQRGGDDFQAPSELRYWSFFNDTGAQLQAWHLDRAARVLWHRGLQDPASVALRSALAPDIIRELRLRTLGADLVAAPPGQRAAGVAQASREYPPDALATLGATLASAGCVESAATVYRLNWERDPTNQQALSGWLNASRALGDWPAARDALLTALALTGNVTAPEPRKMLTIQAAIALRQNNERGAARKVLDDLRQKVPTDAFLLDRIGKFAAEDGDDERAEKAFQSALAAQPGNAPAAQGLQALLLRQGRDAEAAALKAKSSSMPPASSNDALSKANRLATAGKKDAAALLLWNGLARETSPERRFTFQRQLVPLLPKDDPRLRPLLLQMKDSLRLAREAPPMPGRREEEARRNRDFYALGSTLEGSGQAAMHAILDEDWQAGAGQAEAGLALLRLGAEPKVAAQFLAAARELPGPALLEAAEQLGRVGQSALAEQVQRVAFANHRLTLVKTGIDLVQHYLDKGDRSGGKALLDQLAARWIFQDEPAPERLAALYETLGDLPTARSLWKIAIARDPAARERPLWTAYADFLTAQHDPGAGAAWRHLFANRSNLDFAHFLEKFGGTLTLATATDALFDLSLSPWQTPPYWRAVLRQLSRGQDFDAAVDLALAQPEAVLGERGSADLLIEATQKSGRFAEVTARLEPPAMQRRDDLPWLPLGLARLYRGWSEREAVANPDAALAHLQCAAQLVPADFETVKALDQFYRTNPDQTEHRRVLESFLAATHQVKDRAEVSQWLNKLPR